MAYKSLREWLDSEDGPGMGGPYTAADMLNAWEAGKEAGADEEAHYDERHPEEAQYLVLSDVTLSAVQAEATRAHLKHGDKSMLGPGRTHDRRMTIVTEEVGEVAREINDADVEGRPVDEGKLVKELLQSAAMLLTWVEAIEGKHRP